MEQRYKLSNYFNQVIELGERPAIFWIELLLEGVSKQRELRKLRSRLLGLPKKIIVIVICVQAEMSVKLALLQSPEGYR